ncbi:MAG: ABC transporter permease [Candidatus Bathyarchaeia archaeon]
MKGAGLKIPGKYDSQIRDLRYSLYLLRRSALAMLGISLVASIVILATFAPYIAPYGAETRIWADKLQPPNLQHIFGTDDEGGDIFSRVLYGYRLDLAMSGSVVICAATLGTILGAIAGYVRRMDEIVMRITDVFLSVPSLILAMAVGAVLGRTPTNLVIAIAVTWWPVYARLVRGQVLVEKQKLYVEAARASGGGTARILFRHVLPNSIYPILVNATMDLGAVILTTASLSFLGFGVEPGIAELGRMVADGSAYVFRDPWVVAFPGLAILLASLGCNLVGDGLRDVLDPRLRR